MGYRYSEQAISDLRDVVDYIMLDKPQAALAVADEIERMCALIDSMPGIGNRVRERRGQFTCFII